MKLFVLIVKNMRRNLLRTALTWLAVGVLVFIVTLIWSVLYGLYRNTTEKSGEQKLIVTERWQMPSQMPFHYADEIKQVCDALPEEVRPLDYMTWQFYVGTLDPAKRTSENLIFFFGMEPKKCLTVMEDLEDLDPGLVRKLEPEHSGTERGVLMGPERLKSIQKQVGDRIRVTSLNYKGIDLEFEIVGTLPKERYSQIAVMNRDYLNRALEDYKNKNRGALHPMAEKTLGLVWIKVRDSSSASEVTRAIESSAQFTRPAVKCETAASEISTFMDAYRDLLWGTQWLLSPAILVVMSLVAAVAISINVRERVTEMAVLKVLGYQPRQILVLVLGEALLVGGVSGAVSSGLTFVLINALGGVDFRIAFFPAFPIPVHALWWGVVLGAGTGFMGSIMPAWSARTIKVSDVFAKVA
jgi:putative ABC transport system permease protein